jgi:hypothetical protein
MLLSICLQLLLNNSNLHNCSEAMAPKGEKKYDFEFDGVSSGELYRVYRRLLFNEATGITDDGGDSVADLFLQTDVGSAVNPFAHAQNTIEGRNERGRALSRAKKAYHRHAGQPGSGHPLLRCTTTGCRAFLPAGAALPQSP